MRILFASVSVTLWFITANLFVLESSCGKKPSGKVITNNQIQENVEIIPMSQTKVKWIPGTYRGLTPGKSTYQDVKRVFGKPRWEGENEEKAFEGDSEFEILLQYSNGKDGGIDFVVGKETKIVKAISVYPYPAMTKQEIILKYGSNYFEIGSAESLCMKDGVKKGDSQKKLDYPILLVYPETGMSVSIDEDEKVVLIGYLYKCED